MMLTRAQNIAPGLILSGLVAMAAQFISEHSEAPAMMMALLFGIIVNFVYDSAPKTRAGVEFGAQTILKIGIVLLGVRISADFVLALGFQTILLLITGLLATLVIGLILAKAMKMTSSCAILTACAVSICGASAALAISAVLPKNENSEKLLSITIVGVTGLSTVAMIFYPAILRQFGADEVLSGRIIGATIHDVAQVVGAGFSLSEQTGDIATLVKLFRVSLLAPCVIIVAIAMQTHNKASGKITNSAPILPAFVVGFLILAGINSFGLIPSAVVAPITILSKAAFLTAIAAVGIKTNLRALASLGPMPIILMVFETVFLAAFASLGFIYFVPSV